MTPLLVAWLAINVGLLGGAVLASLLGLGRERPLGYGADWRDTI